MSEYPLAETLEALLRNYEGAMGAVASKLRLGDGLLGFGRDPKKEPCHMEFYTAVGEAADRRVRSGDLSPEEAAEAVWLLLDLVRREDCRELTRPMREAVQGHIRLLVPFLTPEAAAALAREYGKRYRPSRRLPVQEQVLRALDRRARGN